MSRRCTEITERRLVTSHHVICWFHTNESSMSLWLAFQTPHFQVAMICGGPRADNFLKQFGRELFMDIWLLLESVKFYNMVAHNCHGKNKIPHGKTKNLAENKIPHCKTKNLTAKPNTSQQNQNSFGFCREYLLLPWDIWFLLWSIWFCCEVFCFCREVFSFAVWYFVFAVRFLVLPWQLWATILQGIIQHLTITSKINVQNERLFHRPTVSLRLGLDISKVI